MKKNPEIENNLVSQIKDEMSASHEDMKDVLELIATTVGGLYYAIYHIWMHEETYVCFREKLNGILSTIGERGEYRPAWEAYIENYIDPLDKQRMEEFSDMNTLASRLKETDILTVNYRRIGIGWTRGQFLVAKRDSDGYPSHVLYTVIDIDADVKLREAQAVDAFEAQHDSLTSVYNRKGFELITQKAKESDKPIAFLLTDIDHFKSLNDRFGHAVGDTVLTAVASCLTRIFRNNDSVFRVGGDEFAVLIENCDERAWEALCRKFRMIHLSLIDEFAQFQDMSVTLSMGLCFSKCAYHDEMYALADNGLYETKRNGRAGCSWIGEDGKAVHFWHFEENNTQPQRLADLYSAEPICIEVFFDKLQKPRLYCNENVKAVLALNKESDPESCFQAWINGIDDRDRSNIREAEKAMRDEKKVECTYLWHHPVWGDIYIRSGGFCKTENDRNVFEGYLHVLKDTMVLEHADDQQLIVDGLTNIYFGSYFIDIPKNSYSVLKAAPGESELDVCDRKADVMLKDFACNLVLAEDRKKLESFFDLKTLPQRLQKERFVDCEYRSLFMQRWCRVCFLSVNAEASKVLMVLALLDADKAKELNAYHYNQRSLSALFHNVPGGVVMYEWDGKILKTLHMSDIFAQTYGYFADKDQALDFSRIHPDDLDMFKTAVDRALNQTHKLDIVVRIRNYILNRYIWFKLDAVGEPEESGHLLIYALFTDVSKQMENERLLEKRQASLDAALDSAGQMCCEYDPLNRELVYLNKKDIFGLKNHIPNFPESVRDFLHPDDADNYIREVQDIDGSRVKQIQVRCWVNGRYRWYISNFYPYYDKDRGRNIAINTLTDISSQMAYRDIFEARQKTLVNINKGALIISVFNLDQDSYHIIKVSDTISPHIDQYHRLSDVLEGETLAIVGDANKEKHRQKFRIPKIREAFEAGITHVEEEYPIRLSENHIEWVTSAFEMMRNPLSGEIEGVCYAISNNRFHMSELMLRNVVDRDYTKAAIVYGETGEFYLFNEDERLFCAYRENYWDYCQNTLKEIVDPQASAKLCIDEETAMAQLDARGEYTFTFNGILNGQKRRMESKFSYLDKSQKLFLGTLRDITDETLNHAYKYAYEHDHLTGLFNRTHFYETAKEVMLKHEDPLALIRIDIKRFRMFNTFFGDDAGDALLNDLADQIRKIAAEYPYAAYGRIEADVFGMLVPYDEKILERQRADVASYLRDYRHDFVIEATWGLYFIDNKTYAMEAMFTRAGIASKTIKENANVNYKIYTAQMETVIQSERQLINEMNLAIENNEFEIYMQPKCDLRNGRIIGAEALVRWNHPILGFLSPGRFIPLFERNGFISRLDPYIWEMTCRLISAWKKKGLDLRVSVNVSRISMFNPHITECLNELVHKYDLNPESLELELTESAYIENPDAMKISMNALRQSGFKILMDDFGSGYSSLNTLREVPVDILKLDMKFLSGDDADNKGRIVLSSVVRMSKLLNLEVIAEGVETVEQVNYLRDIGCEYAQGYYYAKPMKAEDFERLVEEKGYALPERENNQDLIASLYADKKNIIDHMPLSVALIEATEDRFVVVRHNPQFMKDFALDEQGISACEALHKVLSEEDRQKLKEAMKHCALTHEETSLSLRWKNRQIMRAALSYIGSVGDANVLIVCVRMNDIRE